MGWRRGVTIGSFLADSDGSDFRVTTSLSGWEDSAPVRLEVEERSQQDGGWDSRGYYGSRVVEHAGEVLQASRAEALAVLDELNALHPGAVVTYTVDDPNVGVRSALVRVLRGVSVEWVGPVRFVYSLQLLASDPYKYGPAAFFTTGLSSAAGGAGLTYPLTYPLDYGLAPGATPGVIEVPNGGSTSYFPRLRIDGPVTNPVVTLAETGDQIRFTGSVAAGSWLDINCAKRQVLLNGLVSQRHKVTFTGAWLAVPVGGATLTWTADTADPATSLSVWAYEGAWL